MECIYHEKQDGALCGQHCINNLLQYEYFTAVDLATIAQQMDHEEKNRMAESGVDTTAFQEFLAQPSSNMDDSGMFSIQVLTAALKNVELSLINFSSTHSIATLAQEKPHNLTAFLCNFREHWFTIRKIGRQWFNLNSLLTFPELISDTYLSLFLKQLQHEGYSIFIVEGDLPHCEADMILQTTLVTQNEKPKLIRSSERGQSSRKGNDDELRAALKASLEGAQAAASASASFPVKKTDSELDLDSAIRLSLHQDPNSDDEDRDLKKAMQLSMEATNEKKELEEALQMSLDDSLCDVQVPENPLEDIEKETIRKKRLEKFGKK